MIEPPRKLDLKSLIFGFFMANYNYWLKLKTVEDYMNGKGGYYYLAHKYSVTLLKS